MANISIGMITPDRDEAERFAERHNCKFYLRDDGRYHAKKVRQ